MGVGGMIGLGCIVLGFILGGMGVWVAGPVAVLIYVAIWAVLLGIFWHYVFGPMVLANRLMSTGEDGEATIIAIAETGSSLQTGGAIPKPGMRITLDVRPANGKPVYQATIETFISMFEVQAYQPGTNVNVKIDPNNPKKIIIVDRTGAMQMHSASLGSKK